LPLRNEHVKIAVKKELWNRAEFHFYLLKFVHLNLMWYLVLVKYYSFEIPWHAIWFFMFLDK